jgi:hypothetical protein
MARGSCLISNDAWQRSAALVACDLPRSGLEIPGHPHSQAV